MNFVINEKGEIEQIETIRGVREDLDTLCFNAIAHLPNWTPGKIGDKSVSVRFNLPIHFILTDEQERTDTTQYFAEKNENITSKTEAGTSGKKSDKHKTILKIKEIQAKLYPNPATDYCTIELNENFDCQYTLFDVNGRIFKSGNLTDKVNRIDLNDIEHGYYFVRIYSMSDIKGKTLGLVIEQY